MVALANGSLSLTWGPTSPFGDLSSKAFWNQRINFLGEKTAPNHSLKSWIHV